MKVETYAVLVDFLKVSRDGAEVTSFHVSLGGLAPS